MTFRRVQRGKWHSYELDGQRIPAVTTLIRDGIPKPNLIDWAAQAAAEYAADHIDDIARLERDAAVDLIKNAHRRSRNFGAAKGTEIHGYAQALAAGAHVDVPENATGYVDAYLAFLDDWQPTVHRRRGRRRQPPLALRRHPRPPRHHRRHHRRHRRQDRRLRCVARDLPADRRLPPRRALPRRRRHRAADARHRRRATRCGSVTTAPTSCSPSSPATTSSPCSSTSPTSPRSWAAPRTTSSGYPSLLPRRWRRRDARAVP